MKNSLQQASIIGVISLSLAVTQAKNTFADGLTELIMLGAEFCRAAQCDSKVKKVIPEALPKGCRKVYMKIPGDDLFLHSTLVCRCGEKTEDSVISSNIQEK